MRGMRACAVVVTGPLELTRGAWCWVLGVQSHETPLLMAARGGHVDVCSDLIDAGADVTAQDKVGHCRMT